MIKKFFEKDSVLKVVSVFVALLVWLYVIYIEDPEIETTIDDVLVTYSEADLADNLSLINQSIETVNVKISGNRSDVMDIEADDINAVLDLSSVTKSGEFENLKINVSTSDKKIDIVDSSKTKASVKIDDVISRKFDIGVEFDGDMPDGYIIADEPYMDIDSVWVKGAKSYVNNVGGAYIKINCSRLSKNKTIDSSVYLKDKKGNIINKKHNAYKYLEIGDDMVSAYIKVGKTSKAKVEISGKENFEIISVSPQEIEIYCEGNPIDTVYTKSIKDKEPDKDGYITVKLDVPDNVTLVNSEKTIKIKVEKE